MEIKKILIISGPTASGKTKLSLDIAHNNSQLEIVNFDSLLFYQELNIGTAKPTLKEMADIPHHLIDIATISNPLNAARYCEIALPLIEKIHQQKKVPVLVGGSGFYLKALLMGMYPSPTPSKEILEKSDEIYSKEGIDFFINFLKKHDKKSFEKLHPNDHYRIRRAVEFYWSSNYPISLAPQKQKEQIPKYKEMNWNLFHCYLNIPRENHYPIIIERTKKMIADGLIQEVENLMKLGYTGREKPLKSIGYKEVFSYLSEKNKNINKLQEDIFISTRQLAKAQRTWFQSVRDKFEFNPLENYQDAFLKAQEFLSQ